MVAHTLFPTGETSTLRCHLLGLPDELRFMIYEEVLGKRQEQHLSVDISADERSTTSYYYGYHPPRIRLVCKQLYAETSDLFFRFCKLDVYFTEAGLLQAFLNEIGEDNRRGIRHLGLYYSTMGENGAIREDIDIEIWSAVATILKKFFGNDDQVLLETLELETADDRNAGVRFGGSPVEEPREVAITSTVQVIKLVRVFPRLTRLYLEEVLLLGMESDEKESTLENLPIVNFFRTT